MLETLFERALDAIVIVDDQGSFVDANPAACELFGFPRNALAQHRLGEFVADNGFVTALATGTASRGDIAVSSLDGRTLPVEFRAKADFVPGHHLAILRDITERQRVEAELRASAEFLRRLIEGSHDCIKVLDLQGRLLSMNEGGRRLLEMEMLEPYVGRAWLDFWMGGHVDRAQAALESARRGEVARFEGLGATVRGTWRWWETVIAPIEDASGTPERLLAVSRDITDRVEAERQRVEHHRRLQEMSESSSRAKDEFLATLSHELRNPLAAILNGVSALDVIGAATSPAQRARDVIRRQTQHLASLLDDLLDVARIGERKIQLRLEPLDLEAIARAAVEAEMPRIEAKSQAIEVRRAAAPVYVMGDAIRLRQVVANLVNNACKYTPDGGRIVVELEATDQHGLLRVVDSGVGIPPDRLEDVFELFTQLQKTHGRSEGGLGIGLALARRLALLQGGSVTAHSAGAGHGSSFTVRMPISAAPATRLAPVERAASTPSELIVLIEDDTDTRELLADALTRAGHVVQTADRARTGLQIVRMLSPGIVITDIGLPDSDGYEVAAAVREALGSGCFLVAFSGYGQPEDRARASSAGFDAHVVKPVDPAVLLELIAHRTRADSGAAPRRDDASLTPLQP